MTSTAPPLPGLISPSPEVFIGCEESGTIRDTFTRAGFDAMSCDLKPSRTPGRHHQGDVRDLFKGRLGRTFHPRLVIMHPDCTYLTNAGVRWLYDEPDDSGTLKGIPRWKALHEAGEFFAWCLSIGADWDVPPLLAVENPKPHRYARNIIGPPTQYIQPFHFGQTKTKETGLWLRNGLPPLVPTDDVEAQTMDLPYKERAEVHYMSPGADRAEKRSVTYQGIADAMVAQWGPLLRRQAVAA